MVSYVGRFAPSPTGPLHFGSLIAATASYLQARHRDGRRLLRIEDVDSPRTVQGATEEILNTLRLYGFIWDGEVVFQSQRRELYETFLNRLKATDKVYPCACTRREIADSTLHGTPQSVYPGTCRNGLPPGRTPRATRVRSVGPPIDFMDGLRGASHHELEIEVGDFIVRRADGLFAYQFAVVVDDAQQGVTEVVRGSDLLDSTPRQIHLQRLLDLPTPAYMHVPIAANTQGEKLSKQTGAPPISQERPAKSLCDALNFLGQQPPSALRNADIDALWRWAIAHWDETRIPCSPQLVVADRVP